MTALAPTLQAFFTERLITQRQASPHTVAAYRDAFCLLLGFAQKRTGRAPSALQIEDLDAGLIGAFLDHLEHGRGNAVGTRNARLAAVHSLFRFAALRHPEHAALIQRVLAIPPKRADRVEVCFLSRAEVDALLAAPDRSRWVGRRDHALLLVALQTGLRVSELVGLRCRDVELRHGRMSAASAKDGRSAAPHSPPTPSPSFAPGFKNDKAAPTTRCSRPVAADRSAAMLWPFSSPGTPRQPEQPARPSSPRPSPRTCFATPAP